MSAVFCVSSVLICIFRRQLMQLCNCYCPRPNFTPKVTYHTSNEKMNIVDVNDMKTEKQEVEEQTDKNSCLVILLPKVVDPFLNLTGTKTCLDKAG